MLIFDWYRDISHLRFSFSLRTLILLRCLTVPCARLDFYLLVVKVYAYSVRY